jgi:hypothetical protein
MAQDQHNVPPSALVRAALASAAWRKSSYSGDQGNCVEAAVLTSAEWHKSSYSGSAGNCVEIAGELPGAVAIRDSKDPGGPVLVFMRDEWMAFVAHLRRESILS